MAAGMCRSHSHAWVCALAVQDEPTANPEPPLGLVTGAVASGSAGAIIVSAWLQWDGMRGGDGSKAGEE
jgi:hypothetical protein